MPGPLPVLVLALLLGAAWPVHARQDPRDRDPLPPDYAGVLTTYRAGNFEAAVRRVGAISEARLFEAADKLWLPGGLSSAEWLGRIRTAIALLSESSLVRTADLPTIWPDPYLRSARMLVRRLVRSVGDLPGVGEAERRFARDWYLMMVAHHHGRAEVGWSRAFLAEARDLFPNDAHVLLVTGSDHEMVSHSSAGFLERVNIDGDTLPSTSLNAAKELEQAEQFLSRAAVLAPDLVEARLRLGRVLYRRGKLEAAERELRAALALASHNQVRYLALIFLGMVEASQGRSADAERSYRDALQLFPEGQSAMVALSELAYASGRSNDAAAGVIALLAMPRKEDPWWLYLLGDRWHFEARVRLMRQEALQ